MSGSLREQVTEEVQEAASNNQEERETLDQIDVNFSEIPFVKFYPGTLPTGTFPEDEGNPIIRFPDQEHTVNARQDQGYLGLVLEGIGAVTDEDEGMGDVRILETSDSDSTEYRVVDFSQDGVSEESGGDAVTINGDTYFVDDQLTELPEERGILVVDRLASESVARKLDVNGAVYAGMDEETGNVNGGLIEYAFTDDEGNSVDEDGNELPVDSRYARNPELREELYGTEFGIMAMNRSDADSGATGYLGQDESNDEPVVGEGENGGTHRNQSRATWEELVAAEERRDMVWYTVFNMETGDTLQPVEGEPVGYSYLEWRFDPEAGRLPEQDWEFVQEYISADAPTDEETILENIEDNSGKLSDDPNTERMVNLIQNGVTGE
jgi:hypothetical protein